MTGIAIERASPADRDALHRLIESAYRGDSARRGWTSEADLLGGQRTDAQELDTLFADSNQHFIIMREGEDLIGSILVTDKGGGLAYFGMLTIKPDRQAEGLGKKLMAAGEAAAIDFGADRMECHVIRFRPELIAWYERLGYRLTGETRPFPMHDPRFGLPKRDDLEFLVMEKPLS